MRLKAWLTLWLASAALAGCVEAAVVGALVLVADDIAENDGDDGLF